MTDIPESDCHQPSEFGDLQALLGSVTQCVRDSQGENATQGGSSLLCLLAPNRGATNVD